MEEGGTNSPLTPFLYSDHIYKMLNNALDLGVSERDFWEMTIAELERVAESKRRLLRVEQKDKATHNYIHALLVGKALAASFSEEADFPTINEVYPSLFSVDTKQSDLIQERKDELSALRFKQFAESFNQKFIKEEATTINE